MKASESVPLVCCRIASRGSCLGASGNGGDRRRRPDRRVDRPGVRAREAGVGGDRRGARPGHARSGRPARGDRPRHDRPRAPAWPTPTSWSSARRSTGSPTTCAGRPKRHRATCWSPMRGARSGRSSRRSNGTRGRRRSSSAPTRWPAPSGGACTTPGPTCSTAASAC